MDITLVHIQKKPRKNRLTLNTNNFTNFPLPISSWAVLIIIFLTVLTQSYKVTLKLIKNNPSIEANVKTSQKEKWLQPERTLISQIDGTHSSAYKNTFDIEKPKKIEPICSGLFSLQITHNTLWVRVKNIPHTPKRTTKSPRKTLQSSTIDHSPSHRVVIANFHPIVYSMVTKRVVKFWSVTRKFYWNSAGKVGQIGDFKKYASSKQFINIYK